MLVVEAELVEVLCSGGCFKSCRVLATQHNCRLGGGDGPGLPGSAGAGVGGISVVSRAC
jgi:hypothetical protein